MIKNFADFGALFYASPYPALVVDPELIIVAANNEYLSVMGKTPDQLIGVHVLEAFPMNEADIESTNQTDLVTCFNKVFRSGQVETLSFIRYAIPRETPNGVIYDERYWSTSYSPIKAADGSVTHVLQSPLEVTDLYALESDSKLGSVHTAVSPSPGTETFNRAQVLEAMTRILNDERSHLRALFDQAPGFIAVLTGPKHTFEVVNKAYYQLVGHRDIIGKPVMQALPEVAGQGFEELLNEVYRTGKSFTGKGLKIALQPQPNGPFVDRNIDLLYQPFFAPDGSVKGIFAQGHDVTDTYVAQAALKESEQRLREGMVAAKMVVWDFDLATQRMMYSENASTILGISNEIEDHFQHIYPEDLERLIVSSKEALSDNSKFQEMIRFKRPDGEELIWLDVRGRIKLDSMGKSESIRGVAVDVSERMHAIAELRDADKRKDEFLAMLGHELRNPLAPISASAHLLRTTGLDENRVRKTSEIIQRQVDHMTGLVDDLLDVSRVTRGLISIEKVALTVKEVVMDAVEQVRPSIDLKHHQLQLKGNIEELQIIGDHKRLVQVLANLLSNSVKYTPEGGNIVLDVQHDEAWVKISVADNGIGIDPTLLPNVFQLFTQAERSSDRAQGGLGLGLALVRGLVGLHGGMIMAESAGASLGSKFEVSLPRFISMPTTFNSHQESTSTEVQVGRKIMVVDDNIDAAETLAMYLEVCGHDVVVVHDPFAAIETAKKEEFSAFLLDIGLPGMDGYQLAAELRKVVSAGKLIVAISGYSVDKDRIKAIDADFNEHLLKPVDVVLLQKILLRSH